MHRTIGAALVWGSPGTVSNVIGFDGTGVLHVGVMSAQQALDRDIRWACTFTPALIVNGEPEHSWQVTDGSVNPRTAIGQRADGAVLLLVIDGRHISSIGATYEDLIRILLEYGLVVFPRKGFHRGHLKARLLREDPAYRIRLVAAPRVDISSSEIRAAVASGRDMARYLM